MSFFKSLFGGGQKAPQSDKFLGEEEYKGFVVRALEMRAGGEYQLCGVIEKDVDGEVKIHRFIRADRLTSPEQAAQMALSKGKQIIDEQGENVFSA